MSTLVIHRRSQGALPYADWIPADHGPLLLLDVDDGQGAEAGAHDDAFSTVFRVNGGERWAHPDQDEPRDRIGSVVAISELEIMRAARLRARYGVYGQHPSSAILFRDKFRMKAAFSRAGLPVAAYGAVRSAEEVGLFALRTGWPVVVKPVAGTGSAGVRVLTTRAEADAIAFQGRVFIAESFLRGRQFHVDGLIEKGALVWAWATRYINNPLAFQEGFSTGGLLLRADDPIGEPLKALAHAMVRSLTPPSRLVFHAELFETADGQLYASEVACRPGGGRIVDVIREASGIDLRRRAVEACLSRPCSGAASVAALPAARIGWAMIPRREGLVVSRPDQCPFDFVSGFETHAAAGDIMTAPETVGDPLASFLVMGNSEQEIMDRITATEDWFTRSFEIIQAPQDG